MRLYAWVYNLHKFGRNKNFIRNILRYLEPHDCVELHKLNINLTRSPPNIKIIEIMLKVDQDLRF